MKFDAIEKEFFVGIDCTRTMKYLEEGVVMQDPRRMLHRALYHEYGCYQLGSAPNYEEAIKLYAHAASLFSIMGGNDINVEIAVNRLSRLSKTFVSLGGSTQKALSILEYIMPLFLRSGALLIRPMSTFLVTYKKHLFTLNLDLCDKKHQLHKALI